jgi:hypothetical protein
MDCMDCHNRPAHAYQTPNQAVEVDMALGKIGTQLPYIKQTAVEALTKEYPDTDRAFEGIAAVLRRKYQTADEVGPAIAAVQRIYKEDFFPKMKADWRAYPNNIGHKDWPGCFRCHDDKHRTADGNVAVRSSDCTACHTILAQGRGEELGHVAPQGVEFKHPGGDLDPGVLCSDCHNGGSQNQ